MPSERDSNPTVMREGFHVLGHAIKTERGVFTGAVLASGLYGVMTVASSWALGWATEHAVLPAFRDGQARTGALTAAALLIVGVAVLKATGVIGRRTLAGIMQYRMQARSRRDVTRQYLRLPLAWHHRHPTGQLLSNASSDVEAAWAPLAPLPMAVGVVIMLVTAAVAILLVDPMLALVGFLIFPLIAVLNFVYQRRLSPLVMRSQQLRAEVSEIAHESFDGALVVKTLGREDAEAARFRARADLLRDANIAVGRVRGLFDPLLEALPTLGVLAVLLFGALRLQAGGLSSGELVQVAYLFTLLAFPVRALGWVLAELPRSVVGWTRVRAVLDATGSMEHGAEGLPAGGPARVEAQDLTYGYAVDAPVLSGVSFEVRPGRTVAVVGPTGSGKSTLTQLLVRLIDPDDGRALVDGVDLRALAPGRLSAAAALVPQQTFLFDDTVRGNLSLGAAQDVPDEEIWAALRLAQAEGFVSALPKGVDTRVGERGATLSGGQRQRLALARALVRKPRLLILDDATSSVDPQVEGRILSGLREGSPETTVIVVAYRMSTIALADEVVYLEHGRVADRGSHDELLARCQGYRNLVTAYERDEAERAALDAGEEIVA
ncbi:multidrug ABC transporter ATP-binding protein [Sphaerisporangium krabiense]|uniref:ABC-type multidrug transport system fused ATPase/permease subunit n=2 Tax=Sphaerisporangium krabiense TaxID=763782 RepID=A0A7W8Z8J3_9ACTN|nr:ABC-type multidrug transport system fused ATPase/permease subunit [Sphaerisporangium krabiense]GII65792.1 multidrug ABC transporter ATP-binding protein [Sphaerisporangium krabiense]